jgi:hypothetical protein
MRGEEMWEQGLFGDSIAPSIAYAPAGGRFALSRIMLHGSFIADQPISADQVINQTVVVYQTGTGKQLLRADCSPVERAGQNFALSPNGLALAAIHSDAIEIYTLPPLTTKDESDLKLARSIAPPENNLPVQFKGQATLPSADPDSSSHPGPQPAAAANTPPDSTQPAASDQPTTQTTPQTTPQTQPAGTPAPASPSSGDTPPDQHRTPPTLYNLPDDKDDKHPTSPPANPKDPPQ